jgi:hypothetical protein
MGYLNNKPGSIEEVIAKQTALESDYQDKFKKELEKAGKGIGSLTRWTKSIVLKTNQKLKKWVYMLIQKVVIAVVYQRTSANVLTNRRILVKKRQK